MMMMGYHFPNHSASDGAASYFSSSPTDSFQTQLSTPPPPMKGFGIGDLGRGGAMRESAPGLLTFAPSMEGTSALPYSAGSSSSRSDGSEFENIAKHVSSSRNFSGRCSFISKPIHPISFMNQAPEREASVTIASGSSFVQSMLNDNGSGQHSNLKSVRSIAELQSAEFSEVVATTPQREMFQLSSASSSMDFTDVSEQFDCESIGPSRNVSEGFRCGLCERFLSQRSPWSSRRIVRSGDMPVTGVLSCFHIFHADCLEQATPKMMKQDPPCPVCSRLEDNALERQVVSKSRNGLPRVRSVVEDGPSRPWGCGQVGDCVEGALHASPRSNMLSLNRSRLKKHLSSVGTSSSQLQAKLKKSGSSSQLSHGRLLTQSEAKKSQLLQ